MAGKLSFEAIKKLLQDLESSVTRPECRSCACFQSFVTQLELDAQEDVSDLTRPFKVSRSEMHGCLGCDPCPPADVFSAYLRLRKAD
jgi:hypothetical protein